MYSVIRVGSYRLSTSHIEAARILKDKVVIYMQSGHQFTFTHEEVIAGFKRHDVVNWSNLASYIYPVNQRKLEALRNKYHEELEKEKRERFEAKIRKKGRKG